MTKYHHKDTGICAGAGAGTGTASHPRQREPKAKPGAERRQASAKRLARQGGLRVGVGGRCNQIRNGPVRGRGRNK
jgi:hypothetical protein